MSLSSNVSHRQDGRPVELALNRKVIVLGHLRLVLVVVTGHVQRHERSKLEVRKWSVARGEGEGEVLSLRDPGPASDVGAGELSRCRRCPVEAPGSVTDNSEVTLVRGTQIVDTVGCANAGLVLTPDTAGRRVCDTNTRSEIVVLGGRDRAGNSRISRNQVAGG